MDNSRTESLIGKEGAGRLGMKHVTIVGIGGVGGYACVMLARAGVGGLTLIDFDEVSPSNLNRQIVAYKSTIGRKKVDVMKEMIADINEKIEVTAIAERLTGENISEKLAQTNIVIDAIDSVKDKLDLITYCKQNGIYCISAMGAGNRYDVPKFELVDIFKTHDDGLAKVIRKGLRERGIKSHDVVTTFSPAKKVEGVIGSISYYPAMCGCMLASVVVNKILNDEI